MMTGEGKRALLLLVFFFPLGGGEPRALAANPILGVNPGSAIV